MALLGFSKLGCPELSSLGDLITFNSLYLKFTVAKSKTQEPSFTLKPSYLHLINEDPDQSDTFVTCFLK